MVHQVTSDLIGTVRDTRWRAILRGIQQQARGFDPVGCNNDHLTGRRSRAAIGAAKIDGVDFATFAKLQPGRRGLVMNDRACGFGFRDMHGRVIFRLDRADRNT